MTASRDPDRMIHAFLFEGEEQLHDQIYDAVRADIEQKRQRAVFGPWRLPIMNKLVPIGLGAAAVVGVLLIGSQLLGPPNGTGGQSLEPSLSPSASASNTAPPLTETFTSEFHGISISYPTGWVPRPATEPWTGGGVLFSEPYRDFLYDPILTDHLYLSMASQPIGDATPEEWMATHASAACTATEPIEVDGATGLIGAEGCDSAVVTIRGRGYEIHLNKSPDDPAAVAPYDRAWFEEVLATVQLHPEGAVDAPPPLTQSFTSTVHGITLSYPEGWTAQAATEPWTDCLYCTLSLSNPQIDVLYDPVLGDGLMLRIASQPIGESTPEDWVAAQMANWDRCTTTEPIVVDGATGLSGGESCNHALVTTAGRGYSINLWWSPDDLDLVAAYDRAWFEKVLATVQLQPADAVDAAPSASP